MLFPANELVAGRLREAADLLTTQQDNPFRVSAYRPAAESVEALDRDLEEVFNEGGVADKAPPMQRLLNWGASRSPAR